MRNLKQFVIANLSFVIGHFRNDQFQMANLIFSVSSVSPW